MYKVDIDGFVVNMNSLGILQRGYNAAVGNTVGHIPTLVAVKHSYRDLLIKLLCEDRGKFGKYGDSEFEIIYNKATQTNGGKLMYSKRELEYDYGIEGINMLYEYLEHPRLHLWFGSITLDDYAKERLIRDTRERRLINKSPRSRIYIKRMILESFKALGVVKDFKYLAGKQGHDVVTNVNIEEKEFVFINKVSYDKLILIKEPMVNLISGSTNYFDVITPNGRYLLNNIDFENVSYARRIKKTVPWANFYVNAEKLINKQYKKEGIINVSNFNWLCTKYITCIWLYILIYQILDLKFVSKNTNFLHGFKSPCISDIKKNINFLNMKKNP